MSNYVDGDQIQEFLREHKVECLSAEVSKAAFHHLETDFPLSYFTTTRIVDWGRIEASKLNWMTVSDDETSKWAESTIAGQCEFGLLAYCPDQPCLLGKFDFMIRNFDELVWRSPPDQILFGVNRSLDGAIEFTKGIIECTVNYDLYGTVNKS